MHKDCQQRGCVMGLPDCLEGHCHQERLANEIKRKIICNFCYRTQDEVNLIIASDEVGICSDCVLTCVEVVFKGGINIRTKEPFAEQTPNET